MNFELNDSPRTNNSADLADNLPPKGCRLLVVDDDPLVNVMVSTVLRRHGYEVETAADGQEAWEAILNRRFDLMVTDYSMPRMDGLELLRNVRSHSVPLPAIMMSAALPEEIPELFELISPEYALHKPFGIKELLAKVQERMAEGQSVGLAADNDGSGGVGVRTNARGAPKTRKAAPADSRPGFGIWSGSHMFAGPLHQ